MCLSKLLLKYTLLKEYFMQARKELQLPLKPFSFDKKYSVKLHSCNQIQMEIILTATIKQLMFLQ